MECRSERRDLPVDVGPTRVGEKPQVDWIAESDGESIDQTQMKNCDLVSRFDLLPDNGWS